MRTHPKGGRALCSDPTSNPWALRPDAWQNLLQTASHQTSREVKKQSPQHQSSGLDWDLPFPGGNQGSVSTHTHPGSSDTPAPPDPREEPAEQARPWQGAARKGGIGWGGVPIATPSCRHRATRGSSRSPPPRPGAPTPRPARLCGLARSSQLPSAQGEPGRTQTHTYPQARGATPGNRGARGDPHSLGPAVHDHMSRPRPRLARRAPPAAQSGGPMSPPARAPARGL